MAVWTAGKAQHPHTGTSAELISSSHSFDYFLAMQLTPPGEGFEPPTQIAQSVLYRRWKGYAPPGTCTLIPLAGTPCAANKYRCRFIALCPTMRVPQSVTWDRDVVYNCTWSLLNALDQHNAGVGAGPAAADGGARIGKVLMTGLATGVGGVSAERCAQQMALAVKHFLDASASTEKWSSLRWKDALAYDKETSRTHSL